MTRKMFDSKKLHTTVENEDKALKDKFDKADSIMLGVAAATATTAVTAAIALKPVPEPEPQIPPPKKAVRDTFSMHPEDYALIEELRIRVAMAGHISNKSEIIRAGLQSLNLLKGPELVAAMTQVKKMKPGKILK